MKNKKEDKFVDKLMTDMINNMKPEDRKLMLGQMMLNDYGIYTTVLHELKDIDRETTMPEEGIYTDPLPNYLDFRHDCANYKQYFATFMGTCEQLSKEDLSADINHFLKAIPYLYDVQGKILLPFDIWFVACAIKKYGLTDCLPAFLHTLTYNNNFVMDVFEDDETPSIMMFADFFHDQIDQLAQIATNEAVVPFARGIAIAAIAESIEHEPDNAAHAEELVSSIFDYYAARTTKADSTPNRFVKSIAMIAARFQFGTLLPKIKKAYKRIYVPKNTFANMDSIMLFIGDHKHHPFSKGMTILQYIDGVMKFEKQFNFDQMIGEIEDDDEEEDYIEDAEEWDDDYDEDEDEDEDEDDEERYTHVTIYQQEISSAHPKGMISHTDTAYTRLANEIVTIIEDLDYDITVQDVHFIALKSALYFEDMLADAGIWRGFVQKMRSMYGKPLPFYTVDEDDYYPDEPNLQDLQLIIWLVCSDNHTDDIYNPDASWIEELSQAIFDYLMDRFEEMPVNEQLKQYFTEAKFMSSFEDLYNVLLWTYIGCYLTAGRVSMNMWKEMAKTYKSAFGSHADIAAMADCVFDQRMGPLALFAKEWLSLILTANGREKEAELLTSIMANEDFFHVEKREGNLFTLKGTNGEEIKIDRKNFGQKKRCQLEEDYLYGIFAHFRGQWYQREASWDTSCFSESYQKMRERLEEREKARIPDYDLFLQKTGGRPIAYFKNRDELIAFMRDELGMTEQGIARVGEPDKEDETMVMYAPAPDGNIYYISYIAECIKDPANPYYDEEKSKADSFNEAIDMPYPVMTYLMQHNYLPYAHLIPPKDDYADCKDQFQENYDFIFRSLNPGLMNSPFEY